VRTLRVVQVREHGGKGELIVRSDISDRNEAERLAGLLVLIDPEERVVLPEGVFWVDDLIGLQVLDADGGVLGVVEDFISGANEVYVIRDEHGKSHYIPAVGEFVKSIDVSSEAITVKLIEGLW
jgi:16S rRNA processing protein RimM